MLVKDLVRLDQQGWLSSAVQLSDYEDTEKNYDLVRSYIFTTSAPDTYGGQTRSIASMDLLKDIKNSFLSAGSNRYHVIANYGHGKSHLGLVIANYFSKPYKSRETQAILARISQAVNDPTLEEDYHEFKKQHEKSLVLRLRGDTPRTLREQFFPALKCALEENDCYHKVDLPFWNQTAKNWLESKRNDKEASLFLDKNFNTDVPNLINDIDQNKLDAYDQYIELFKHLNNGVSPSAEGNLSLREAVKWVIDHLCDEGKLFSGLVVVFDEFSLFIQRYCQSKATSDLQELLDGVGERRGKSVFIAFAQHDPNEIAEQTQSGKTLENIKKELDRIDSNKKFVLHSLMESVLASYLGQSSKHWKKMLDEEKNIKGQIYGETTETVWDYFLERYNKRFRWTHEKFREVVAEGCFPLHPFTVALLCSLDMKQGEGEARTILGFVRDQLEPIGNENIVINGKINWIFPITLVDYFERNLVYSPSLFDAFENACNTMENILGEKATNSHRSILKALLLQEAGKLKSDGNNQVSLISHLAGIEWGKTIDILKELAKLNIIRYDPELKKNSFWPVSVNPKIFEQKINELLGLKTFDSETVFLLNNRIHEFIPGSDKIPVKISWAHPDDWSAIVRIFTPQTFTIETLNDSLSEFKLIYSGIKDGSRGMVGWFITSDEDEVIFLQQNARRILDESFTSDYAPPILLILPHSPKNDLVDAFLKLLCIEEIGRDQDALNEIGQSIFKAELDRIKKIITFSLGDLFGDIENYVSIPRRPQDFITPAKFQPILNNLPVINLNYLLEKLYELSYPYHPPDFFSEFRLKQTQLRDAVKKVSANLINNKISNTYDGMTPVAQRLCKDYLLAHWKILSTTYWIQKPDYPSLERSWNFLEVLIESNEQEVPIKEIIPVLLNRPYGFDYNTILLLVCSWIGKNKNELRFSENGRLVGLDFLEKELLEKGSLQDTLGKLCNQYNFAISRRDVEGEITECRNILNSIQSGEPRTQKKAMEENGLINNLIANNDLSPDELAEFEQAMQTLTIAIDSSKEYDDEVEKIIKGVSNENDIHKIISFCSKLKSLEFNHFVTPTQPSIENVQSIINNRIDFVIGKNDSNIDEINTIESAILERNQLSNIKEILNKAGFLDFETRISESIEKISSKIKGLEIDQQEAAIVNEIQAMTRHTYLSKLYEYQGRLKTIISGSDSLLKKRDMKLDEINTEINNLETFAQEVINVASHIRIQEADNLLEKIFQNLNRYSETDYEKSLIASKDYVYCLKEYSQELIKIQSLGKTSPNEVDFLRNRIIEIRKLYQDVLSKNHIDILDKLDVDIVEYQNKKVNEAQNWLRELESNYQEISTDELKRKLENTPVFLPSDSSAQIKKIKNEYQARMSQDIILKIEELFNSLSNVEKKRQCLDRLKKILLS